MDNPTHTPREAERFYDNPRYEGGLWQSINTVQLMMYNHFARSLESSILKFQEDGKTDVALDILFKDIDFGLIDGEYKIIDHLCKFCKLTNWGADLLVGLLTITFPFKEQLKNRESLFKRVRLELLSVKEEGSK